MSNYKLFNENAGYDSIEFDIVKSIIDELNSKNIEISSLTVKNKLRDEEYYVEQKQVSSFLKNNYKNLNLSFSYSTQFPIYKIYKLNDIPTDIEKEYLCSYSYFCGNKLYNFNETVIAATPGKAKYKFKKMLLDKYPSLDILYIYINARLKK